MASVLCPVLVGRGAELDALVFSGTVRTTDGSPLAGAMVDVWQASAAGEYANFHPTVPAGNLRGRLTTDEAGLFEFETIVPPSYGIPDMSSVLTASSKR